MEPRETRFSKCPMIDTFFRYPVSSFIVIFTDRHQFKLSPNKNTSEHALHIHTCTLHCRRLKRVTHTQSAGGERCWRAKSSSPKPSFLTNSQSRSQQSVKWCRFQSQASSRVAHPEKSPSVAPGNPHMAPASRRTVIMAPKTRDEASRFEPNSTSGALVVPSTHGPAPAPQGRVEGALLDWRNRGSHQGGAGGRGDASDDVSVGSSCCRCWRGWWWTRPAGS